MTRLIDDEEALVIRCDRCGEEEWDFGGDSPETGTGYRYEVVYRNIFFRRPKMAVEYDFCLKCAKEVVPFYWKLRDIDETNIYINKLKRAINERRRTKNDGPTPRSFG